MTDKNATNPDARRRLALAGLGVAAGHPLLTGFSFNWRRMLPPRDREIVSGGKVVVPKDFIGIHMHRWPYQWRAEDMVSPKPTYRYGTVRSLNYDGVAWRDIHIDRNEYDFAHLDKWVRFHHEAGKTVMFCFYGTPTRFSTRPEQKDPYHYPGGDSRPKDMEVVNEFITAMVKRYNGDGTRRIQYIDVWNEPDFHGGRYWRDTSADLAELCRRVYQSAKAVDPGIRVLSPPFNDLFEGPKVFKKIVDWAEASDGAGGKGAKWADGMAFHYYHYWDENPVELLDVIEGMRMTRTAIGREDLDLYLTEIGENKSWTDLFPSQDAKIKLIKRWLLVGASAGLKMMGLYSHELQHLGSPAYNPRISQAIDEMYQLLSGATITDATLFKDGHVEVSFAVGRKVSV
ncbi:MAG: hypothetical protein R3E48_20600 [Burkholderiaceae bacterium]